ncbi:hypothetical protein F3J38_13980 [Pantoea sp. Acro-805]|uniref:t-SNARE coiled-coil homology domain-containing protein n=2 Tax=Candidatus Pantoea formicae TaxID=2608355 RepID=A0ABX0QVV1_9GAMM|nr:hypothetical protein [Pantoea formicae]
MILTMMNTHKAYKALQDAGVADKQAEVLVEIFADMQQENALTKFDLSQAMEGMARAQSATTHRLDSLEGRFDKFEKDVNQRFDKIEDKLVKIDERFDKIDEKFDKIDEKFIKIDEKFIKIDEKFDKIDEKFEKIDQRFEKVDERLNKQDVKLSDLDQRMQIGFAELKQDNVWIRRILLTIATALIAMTTKYILSQ